MTEREIDLPGKSSAIEEAILIYMYEHPLEIGTANLVQVLRPGLPLESDETRQAWEDVQYGIETLVKDRLVRGTRQLHRNLVQYSNLTLTADGEVEAITQKRRAKKLAHSVPQPDRSEESSA
jgi:hypothetical protein